MSSELPATRRSAPDAWRHACTLPLPSVRWENREARRYYEVRVTRGLFDEWFVMRYWGGIGSEYGGQQASLAVDREDAVRQLDEVAHRRLQRGYVVIRP